MSAHPESEDRLSALRAEDHFKIWKSLEDQRVCILCEKKFNGHEVEITWSAEGRYELHCPTKECNSGPHQWVYPGSLLISDIIGRTGGVPSAKNAAGHQPSRRHRQKPATYD